MTDHDQTARPSSQPALDSELNMRGIFASTAGLVIIVVLAIILMWGFVSFLFGQLQAEDPPPPALEEARQPYEPPAPRLQTDPVADIDELQAADQAQLSSFGWVNQTVGSAHIPIERAIDLLVESGSVDISDKSPTNSETIVEESTTEGN